MKDCFLNAILKCFGQQNKAKTKQNYLVAYPLQNQQFTPITVIYCRSSQREQMMGRSEDVAKNHDRLSQMYLKDLRLFTVCHGNR